MALLSMGALAGMGGLLDACESARSQLSEGAVAAAAPASPRAGPASGALPVVRGPRSSRGVKRSREELAAAHTLLAPTSPVKSKRPSGKRASGKWPLVGNPTQGEGARPAGRRARAPRSPDEKRKLSRQMAAFMRLGVLVLPADVKARRRPSPAPLATLALC
jgi:hypothetical protein